MHKLFEYLNSTRGTGETAYERYDRFAGQLGVTGHSVRKWVYGQRRMPDRLKIVVERITHGAVTVDDLVRG